MLGSLIGKVMTYDTILPYEKHQELKKFANNLPFETPSFVFNTHDNKNEINKDVRNSKTVILDNKDILEFINTILLKPFKTKNSHLTIKLARNHVTFIKYEKNDFFDWHNDFEKIVLNKRNKWLEMQFIYCIVSPELGGELQILKDNEKKKTYYDDELKLMKWYEKLQDIIEIKNNDKNIFKWDKKLQRAIKIKYHDKIFKYDKNIFKYDQVCTENCAIVFDKVLKHRGQRIIKGTKIIIVLDLLISNKQLLTIENYTLQTDKLLNLFNEDKINIMCSYSQDILIKLYHDKLIKFSSVILFKYININDYKIYLDYRGVFYIVSPSGIIWKREINTLKLLQEKRMKNKNKKVIYDAYYHSVEAKIGRAVEFFSPYNDSANDSNDYSNNYHTYFDPEYKFIEIFLGQSEIHDLQEMINIDLPLNITHDNISNNTSILIPTIKQNNIDDIDLYVEKNYLNTRRNIEYTYHCNEPSYDKIEVNIVYGIIKC